MVSKKADIILTTLVILSAIGYFIAIIAEFRIWSIILFILMIIFCVLFLVICKRCPHCGRVGGRRAPVNFKDPGYCSFCGEKIEYKEDS